MHGHGNNLGAPMAQLQQLVHHLPGFVSALVKLWSVLACVSNDPCVWGVAGLGCRARH